MSDGVDAAMIALFTDLSEEARHTNPEDVHGVFEQSLTVMLNARDMEMSEIEDSPLGVPSFASRFRALLDLEAWFDAAMMLAPVSERTGPGYHGGFSGNYWAIRIDTIGYDDGVYQQGQAACVIHHPLSSGGGPLVKGFHASPGVAVLIATLKAHAEWPELWKTTSFS